MSMPYLDGEQLAEFERWEAQQEQRECDELDRLRAEESARAPREASVRPTSPSEQTGGL